MNRRIRNRAIRWILLSALALVLLSAAGVFWGWNSRSRPGSIVGDWILDDLRTDDDDVSLVTFHSTGVYDGDPEFSERWRFADGLIHIRCWRNDSGSAIGRSLVDTTAYAWFVKADEFSLVPTFNEDRSMMTLAFPGKKPHVSLRRSDVPVQVKGRTK